MTVRLELTVRSRECLSHTGLRSQATALQFSVISLEQAIARAAVDLREKLRLSPLKP